MAATLGVQPLRTPSRHWAPIAGTSLVMKGSPVRVRASALIQFAGMFVSSSNIPCGGAQAEASPREGTSSGCAPLTWPAEPLGLHPGVRLGRRTRRRCRKASQVRAQGPLDTREPRHLVLMGRGFPRRSPFAELHGTFGAGSDRSGVPCLVANARVVAGLASASIE